MVAADVRVGVWGAVVVADMRNLLSIFLTPPHPVPRHSLGKGGSEQGRSADLAVERASLRRLFRAPHGSPAKD